MIIKTKKDRIFSNINYVLLLCLACNPILCLLFSCFLSDVTDHIFFYIWTIISFFVFITYFLLNIKDFKIKKAKDKLVLSMTILLCVCLFCVVISSFLHPVTVNDLNIFMYAMLFFSILLLQKNQTKVFLFILISNFVLGCLFSIMDPTNYFVPGFQRESVPSSSFFSHANYSQAISVLLIIITYHLMLKEKNKILSTVYVFYFIIMGLFMFINSSFVGISCVFLILITEFIVNWIRNKKFPLKLLLIFLSYVSFAFIVELYPNIHGIRSGQYNYFVELIDVFDNIFGTNLTKGLFGVENVPGSDGWSRTSLITGAISAMFSGSFGQILCNNLFGLGGGNVHILRPHNMFVGAWVDFGIIFAICLYAIFIIGIIYIIKKSKNNLDEIMPYVYAIIAYIIAMCFGSIIICHYMYFIAIFALAFNKSNEEKEEMIEQKQVGYKILHKEKEQQ